MTRIQYLPRRTPGVHAGAHCCRRPVRRQICVAPRFGPDPAVIVAVRLIARFSGWHPRSCVEALLELLAVQGNLEAPKAGAVGPPQLAQRSCASRRLLARLLECLSAGPN